MPIADMRGLVLNACIIPGQKMYEDSDLNCLSGRESNADIVVHE